MEPDKNGFFGQYGGAYIPEILYKVVHDLQDQYKQILDSKEFQDEYYSLLKDYVGRPSPLYYASRMSDAEGLCRPSFTPLLCQSHERKVWL